MLLDAISTTFLFAVSTCRLGSTTYLSLDPTDQHIQSGTIQLGTKHGESTWRKKKESQFGGTKLKRKSKQTYISIIASNHLTEWDTTTSTICGFVRINWHIESTCDRSLGPAREKVLESVRPRGGVRFRSNVPCWWRSGCLCLFSSRSLSLGLAKIGWGLRVVATLLLQLVLKLFQILI